MTMFTQRLSNLAVLGLALGCISQSSAGQTSASRAQQPEAQSQPDAHPPNASQPNWYVDDVGHLHLLLTPEGDIVQPPSGGMQPPGAAIPATPAFPPCPPDPEVVRRIHDNVADKSGPQLIAYTLFFNNIAVLDDVAEQDEKRGNHEGAAAWRTHDQRLSGLNDTEGQILKEIEVDFNRAMKEYDARVLQAIRKHRLATKGDMCAPSPPEFAELDRERWSIAKAHIARLQVALGAMSFEKLDKYVRSVWEPKPQPQDQQQSETKPRSKK